MDTNIKKNEKTIHERLLEIHIAVAEETLKINSEAATDKELFVSVKRIFLLVFEFCIELSNSPHVLYSEDELFQEMSNGVEVEDDIIALGKNKNETHIYNINRAVSFIVIHFNYDDENKSKRIFTKDMQIKNFKTAIALLSHLCTEYGYTLDELVESSSS
jgi:hypothetical protein